MLEDGIVQDGSHSIEQGVGVRAMSGEKTGFAYSDDIVHAAAAGGGRRGARHRRRRATAPAGRWRVRGGRALYPAIDPVDSLPNEDKIRVLREVDAHARSAATRA